MSIYKYLNFFKINSDEIDRNKVAANIFVLKYGSGSYRLAESYANFDEGHKELLKFSTKSIKKIDPIGGTPLGFALEFIATYPDVVLWWKNLSDEKQEEFFKDVNEKDFLDKNNKIRPKYLMALVSAYKAAGFELECALSIEKRNEKEDVRSLAKPLTKWLLILLVPSSVAVYFFVDNRLGLAIFLGILFSAFGSVFMVAVFLYNKKAAKPIRKHEDLKQQ